MPRKQRALTLIEVMIAGFLIVSIIGSATVGIAYYFVHSLKIEQKRAAYEVIDRRDAQVRDSLFSRDLGQYALEPMEINGETYKIVLMIGKHDNFDTDKLRAIDYEVTWEGRQGTERLKKRYLIAEGLDEI